MTEGLLAQWGEKAPSTSVLTRQTLLTSNETFSLSGEKLSHPPPNFPVFSSSFKEQWLKQLKKKYLTILACDCDL